MKSKEMRYAEHVARIAKNSTVYRIVVGTPEGKTPLGRLRLSMKSNIDMDLNTSGWDGMDGTQRQSLSVQVCCEHEDELLGFINFGNV